MKRRLGLLGSVPPEASDAHLSIAMPDVVRRAASRPTIAVISVERRLTDPFIEVLSVGLVDPTVVTIPATLGADEIDAALMAAYADGTGWVVARGEVLPARVVPDLLVAITFGRALSRQPPLFRRLLPNANLVLSEPRLGVAAELARHLRGQAA